MIDKNNATVDLKSKSLFARLKRLFSTDVIVRNVGGKMLKIKDTDQVQYATDRNTLRDRFNRVRTSGYGQYTKDFSLAYQASRLELFRDYDCVGEDTVIPLPDGTRPTIKELAEKYKDKPQERFYVFSYDHSTDSIKLGKAYHPRKKGKRVGYKVTFDNGQYVIGSIKHPFLMRNGEYKTIYDLAVGDSVMPFYQSEYGYKGHGFKRYRRLYNFSNGYESEHKIIIRQFQRSLKSNEVVHHKNFNGTDNSPENLQIMDRKEHKIFHSNHNKLVLWGVDNYQNQLKKLLSHPNYINRRINHWNGKRSGKNNPFYGKLHSEESNDLRSASLKESFKDRDITLDKNPNYRDDLTIDVLKIKAQDFYKENGKITLWGLIGKIGCDYTTFQSRLKQNNISWEDFKYQIVSELNHKVISIEPIGNVDVYDVTVEEYHNFATDSVFVSNTMDMDPIISSALDIYSDECLTENEMGFILNIKTSDNNVKKILQNLFYDILNIEFNLWSWSRNMCKYGDFYLKLHISPEYGVYLVEPLSSYNVLRIENSDPMNKNYVKYQVSFEAGVMEELESYQVAHFRLVSDSNFMPYGKSMVEGARRVWKQLSLMEDAMLIHRIMRAPDKRVFKIDVGNIPAGEVDTYMEKLITKMKKVPYIDEKTGDYNLRFNLQNMAEDFYLPVRGGDSGTAIEPLAGMEFTGTEDIEYLRNKMMAALKIPKAFLGYEEDLSGKATLASEDVRFARTISRIQRILVSELSKIAVVHLYCQGYKDASLVDFSLELTNPSTIFEQEKVSIWSDKVSVAKDMMDSKVFSKDWIYTNLFKMSADDILKNRAEVISDSKESWRFAQIEEEGNDPALSLQKVNKDGDVEDVSGNDSRGSSGGPGGGIGQLSKDEPPGEDTGEGGEEDTDGGSEPGLDTGAPPESGDKAGADEPEPLSEKSEKRASQRGIKRARDYPFGEDPLGRLENRETNRTNPLRHKFKNDSPLGFESINFSNLNNFLSSNPKKDLLRETAGQKSLMDESNIIDDQKI